MLYVIHVWHRNNATRLLGAWLRRALQSAEKNFQRAKSISISICPFALARTSDVKNVDLVFADKIDHQLCGAFGGSFCGINQHVLALEFVTAFDRIFRSAAQLVEVN